MQNKSQYDITIYTCGLQVTSYNKESSMEKAWNKTEIGTLEVLKRTELKDTLGLTGCEVSFNQLGAGQSSPFVHKHKQNEEVYLVLSGSGDFWLDGEIVPVNEGSCLKISPDVGRSIRASKDRALTWICIQAASNSLKQYTRTDGVILDTKTAW